MEKIASFTIDHERLLRGIYVSRRDTTPAGDTVTTFDIRMTEPNREPALTPESLHAMEHLAATYLRNRPDWRDRVVYWGPMGCCTGNYLLMQGALEPCDILQLMRDTMDYVASFNSDGTVTVALISTAAAAETSLKATYVSYHTTYCNALNMWIAGCQTAEEVQQIFYGADVPDEYRSEVLNAYLIQITDVGWGKSENEETV